MVAINDSLKHGPATDELLANLEAHIGATLPDDYKEFLRQHNGGTPEPSGFLFTNDFDEEEENGVYCFFPARELNCGEMQDMTMDDLPEWPLHCAWDDLQSDLKNLYEITLENAILPIGTDGSSNYIVIQLEGDNAGSMMFFEHEMARVSPLAPSFKAFLDSLHD